VKEVRILGAEINFVVFVGL